MQFAIEVFSVHLFLCKLMNLKPRMLTIKLIKLQTTEATNLLSILSFSLALLGVVAQKLF